jgi:hypothetical protein
LAAGGVDVVSFLTTDGGGDTAILKDREELLLR